jgi:hypothetical protein
MVVKAYHYVTFKLQLAAVSKLVGSGLVFGSSLLCFSGRHNADRQQVL